MIAPIADLFFATSADPILTDGAISASWVLAGLVVLLAFFLVRFINQMDTLTKEVQSLQRDHNNLRRDFDNKYTEDYVEGQNARIAELIYAKIKGITPP
jgi:cell division protein FtsL